MRDFTCNVCGRKNTFSGEPLDRERPSCTACGSNVRTRGLLQALSLELFGINLPLPDFPRIKSLRGIGLSDPNQYALGLAEKFDYRNTFFDREPRFDILNPPEHEAGRYDFVISSEIFEHVLPPAGAAFQNAHGLLKQSGVLILTVPYSVEQSTLEHYPLVHEFGFARLGERTVLVNRTPTGAIQVFENPVFHSGFGDDALEMREFSECDLRAILAGAGFESVRIHAEDYPEFGIVRSEAWSLPVSARRGPFTFGFESTRELLEEWRDLKRKFKSEMDRFSRSIWFRAGRRLKLL